MSGPSRIERAMCARCSTLAVVTLCVDAVDDPAARYPLHHLTVEAVCDEHVDVGVRTMLDALNARPTRRPPSTPPPPPPVDRGQVAHFAELAGVFRLAADMLEVDGSWSVDEIATVQARLRRLAANAPTIGRRR